MRSSENNLIQKFLSYRDESLFDDQKNSRPLKNKLKFKRLKAKCSPHDRLGLSLVYDVLSEPLQKLGVLALVDDPESRSRSPATGVDH